MSHLYEKDGIIHKCEKSMVHNRLLVWTKCGKDVPANKSFMSEEQPTCEKCNED